MITRIRTGLLAFFAVFVWSGSFAQISFNSTEELKQAANELFEQQEFEKAKPLFSQLLSKDALDPNYNYRFGVCIMFTEAEPLKPLPYIEGAANSAGVNAEAHYFLGRIYQLNYRFDEAITAYEKAKKVGFSKPTIDVDRQIAECRNGKILFNEAVQFNPDQEKEVIESEFYRPYDFRKLKGKVIPTPPSFKTKYDEKNLVGTFVYTPTASSVLFFASYGENGARAKDIYRVNRLPNGEWAIPMPLPSVINTKYDEDYAFFDEQKQILYFASKGHNTMGGYDVFSSKYDARNDKWSTPLNLQYPINSPYDDFLYVSDPDDRMAFFTSSRKSDIGKLRVFKTLLFDPLQVDVTVVEGTFLDETDSIYNYMAATVFDPITKEVVGKYRSHKITGKYLLVLPPQNDYTFDVGPKEAQGFKFDLDVPKQDATKPPLKQTLYYNNTTDQGEIELTNYFDGSGKADTVVETVSRNLSEVEPFMTAMPVYVPPGPSPAEIALKKEKAIQDSISKAEQLAALKIQEKAEKEAAELAAKAKLAKEEEVRVAAAAEAERTEREKALLEEQLVRAENTRKDSLAEMERLALSVRKKAIEDSIAQIEQLAAIESAKKEAELKAQSQALAAAAKAAQDSVDRAESMLEAQRIADEAAKKAEADHAIAEAKAQKEEEAQALRSAQMEEEKKAAEIKRQAELASLSEAQKLEAKETARKDSVIVRLEELAKIRRSALKDSLEKQHELVRMQRLKRDSLIQAKELALQLEKARKEEEKRMERRRLDSIQFTQRTELERNKKIALEAEMAKERARKDSVEQIQLAESIEMEEAVDSETVDLFKEMEAVERQLLAERSKAEKAVSVKEEEVVAIKENRPIEMTTEDNDAEVTNDSVTPIMSESDLFLQTLARLEQQKQQQDSLIAAEKKPTKPVAQEAIVADSDTTNVEDVQAGSDVVVKPERPAITKEEGLVRVADSLETDEKKVMALKSDADPNEFLAALHKIEDEISQEAKETDKSYELRDIDLQNSNTVEADRKNEKDPALAAKIAEDRIAIAEHQKVAQEKEKRLKDKLKEDREVLELYDPNFAGELKNAEQEMLATETRPSDVNENIAVDDLIIEEAEDEVAEKEDVQVSEQLDEVIAAEDDSPVEIIRSEEEVSNAASEVDVAEVEEVDVTENEGADVAEETIDVETVQTQEEEPVTEVVPDELELLEELKAAEDMVQPEKTVVAEESVVEPSEITMRKEAASKTSLHLMTPALRDYRRSNVSFDGIEDRSIRRLVQRMRAEDIGRMGVLKNIHNEKIDASGNTEKLETIKENMRNQDVLARAPKPAAREEFIRAPFNRDDLRQRQDVFYKLNFEIQTGNVSETVQNAMTPELLMTFAMPEFNITAEYYRTLADARAGYYEYKNKGFSRLSIIPYYKGTAVLMEEISEIPFIE